jgi:uncharacterized C2H2 Zn-finger protein
MSKQDVVDELNAKGKDTPSLTSQALAAVELGTAWANHKKNGLEFGRVCSEWRTKFKAQGTHTDASFSGILKSLDIPRHIADYWADQYEFRTGKHSIPCPECTETFPSKNQLKKHQRKAHPKMSGIPAYVVEDYSQHPELQAVTGNRSHGQGVGRLRAQAKQLGIDCQIGYTATEGFRVQFDRDKRFFPEESSAKDFLNASKSKSAQQEPTVECVVLWRADSSTSLVAKPTPEAHAPTIENVSEPPTTKCAFDELISALSCLTNDGSDDVEHNFIGMLEDAFARCESTPVAEDGREKVIYLLDRISKEFSSYAERLKKTVTIK